MTIIFQAKHPGVTAETLGYIPHFLSEKDPRTAREQLDAHYQHGGGWQPSVSKFEMLPNGYLRDEYPEDPDLVLLAEGRLHEEVIRIYQYSYVAVIQPNGAFEVARMD